MGTLATWLPVSLGAVIALAVCYKVFTDPKVSNYLGYGLLTALFLCALPSLQHVSYSGSLGQFSADLKNNEANQNANLGSDINAIGKKVDTIITALSATETVTTQITPQYQENKTNEVLVYFVVTARMQAGQIRDYLLNSGYKSAATLTDFSELSPPLPPVGSVRLVYTAAMTDLANKLRAQLHQKFPQLNQLNDDIATKLNSGDVQLQLF